MKMLLGLLVLTTSATFLGVQDRRSPKASGDPAVTTRRSPFACDRMALSPADRTRHFDELGPALQSMRTGVRELPNGYAFRFPGDAKTIQLVAEWAAGERACCPFFDIELRLDREDGPFWLSLTGREGTKEFLKADGASWIKQ